MSTLPEVSGLTGAFVAGLVTSLHCVGMCGPLACGLGLLGGRQGDGAALQASVGYQGARMLAYTTLGAIAGAVGYIPSVLSGHSLVSYLPWFMVVVLVVIGFGWEKRIPRIPAFSGILTRWRLRFHQAPPWKKGVALGVATPLLPCGPLYAMVGIGLLSGSAVRGAELMLAFGLGTLPLLWVAQTQTSWWGRRLNPTHLSILQRGVALLTAAVIAWRLRDTLPFVETGGGCCTM